MYEDVVGGGGQPRGALCVCVCVWYRVIVVWWGGGLKRRLRARSAFFFCQRDRCMVLGMGVKECVCVCDMAGP